MILKLKQCLKKNDFVYIVYHMLTSKEYRDYCADYYRNARIFRFEHLGDENPDVKIYCIQDGFETSGMFALVIRVLRQLEVADRFLLTPVVMWNEVVPYNVPGQPNTFLTYFQPVSDISFESAKHSEDVAFSKMWNCAYGSPLSLYELLEDDINRLAVIYQKYLKLRPEIQTKIDREVDELFGTVHGKVLGVHVRGVEWRKMQVAGHPVAATEQDYLQAAHDMMCELGCEKIFLASDSDGTIDLFRTEFGNCLITTQAVRAPAGGGELAIFDEENDSYQMGYEILRDAYALAACNALLCGRSHVSYGVRIINKAVATPYEKVMLLDKGVSAKGTPVQASRIKQQKEIRKANKRRASTSQKAKTAGRTNKQKIR